MWTSSSKVIFLVDLVGEQDQVVPPGQVGELLQDVPGIDGPGGVVRVDDHDGPVRSVIFASTSAMSGHQLFVLIAQVVHGVCRRSEHGGRRPQRVVR